MENGFDCAADRCYAARSRVSIQIENQSKLATEVDGGTRNPFQRDILKLRAALLLYLRLKNTVQVDGSPDFAKEVNLCAGAIGPGLQSVTARNEGKSFDQNAFQTILAFTQRYQNLAQAKYAYAFPDPSGANETDRWQHVGRTGHDLRRERRVRSPLQQFQQLLVRDR